MSDERHRHAHANDHPGHSHGVSADTSKGRLAVALVLIIAFMAGEVVAGILAHSLALLSDAAHMLTATQRSARKPAAAGEG